MEGTARPCSSFGNLNLSHESASLLPFSCSLPHALLAQADPWQLFALSHRALMKKACQGLSQAHELSAVLLEKVTSSAQALSEEGDKLFRPRSRAFLVARKSSSRGEECSQAREEPSSRGYGTSEASAKISLLGQEASRVGEEASARCVKASRAGGEIAWTRRCSRFRR